MTRSGHGRDPRSIALSFGFVAAAVGIWAFLDPAFRSDRGALTTAFCLPLSASLAALVLAISARREWGVTGRWMALAVLGQGAALQLVDAGPVVGYQHYRLSTDDLLALILVSAQAVVVAYAIFPWLGKTCRWLTAHWSVLRMVAVGGVFVLTSATLSRDPRFYVGELLLASLVQLVNLGTVVLAVAAAPESATRAVRRAFGGEERRIGRLPWFVAGWVVVVASFLAVAAYQAHPHLPDELLYLQHSRYFAEGRLSLPPPPVADGFSLDLMFLDGDRWYSPAPPGWPAVLALGGLAGVPWLVNPVLAGVCVMLSYVLLADLLDVRTARLGVVLLGASPWFIFLGMSYLTHMSALACALAAAVSVSRLRRGGRQAWGWVGGAFLGLTSLIRPLEGLAAAIVLGLWALGARGKRVRFAPVIALTLGAIGVGALVLPYNARLTGNAWYFPIMAYTDANFGPSTNALGFGPDRGLGWTGLDPLPGHGPLDILINANLNTFAVNIELFGWSVGSLIVLAAFLFSGAIRKVDLHLMVPLLVVVGLHGLYWFSGGPDFGARYWFLIILSCVALTARGLWMLGERYEDQGRLIVGALALCAVSFLTFLPWRAIDKYHGYRGMRPDVRVLAETHEFGESLVLIRGERHPDYHSAAAYNPLDLRATEPIYAWDRSAEVRDELLRTYSGRPAWIVEGPTLTGGEYRVREGPLAPDELLDQGADPL